MGVCYAIVHDETREALDLDKGWGWLNGYGEDGVWPPKTRGALMYAIASEFKWLAENAERLDKVTNQIWSFIQAHPGCRVEHDCGDVGWTARDEGHFREERLRDDPYFYVEIGSIYDR